MSEACAGCAAVCAAHKACSRHSRDLQRNPFRPLARQFALLDLLGTCGQRCHRKMQGALEAGCLVEWQISNTAAMAWCPNGRLRS